MDKVMRDAEIRERAESADDRAQPRAEWKTPSLRRLSAASAEVGPSNVADGSFTSS